MRSVIFLSNCYGEDRSAAIIAKELKGLDSEIKLQGAPLISKGEEYEKRNIPLLIKSKVPPSGGFPTRSISGFIKDALTSSYIPLRYCYTLKKHKKEIADSPGNCVIAVGDISLLLLGYLGFCRKIILLAPAKSNYQNPHCKVEIWLMRKLCIKVFTHDEYTAQNLRRERVNAEFVGNPMVDELTSCHSDPEHSEGEESRSQFSIGILPGSREEGYNNFLKILTVIELLEKKCKDLTFITALPSTLDFQKLIILCNKKGWTPRLSLVPPYRDPALTVTSGIQSSQNSIKKNSTEIFLYYNTFVDIVESSDIIIGLAGTANEQAAALGKPIVAFKGTGPQTTDIRMRNQERLLGGCLKYVKNSPDEVVNEIIRLLEDKKLRDSRGTLGRKRMGHPGGAKKIAEFIINGR